MDFGKFLKDGWDLYLKGIVKLVLFVLVGSVLTMTIILMPTVFAGFCRAFLAYVREGKEPEFNELWNFDNFGQTLLFLIVGGGIIFLGSIVIIPGIIFGVWWMYSVFFIVDRQMGFWDAMSASKQAVSGTGFFNHFVIMLIVGVINSVGSAVMGVGTLLTMPYTLLLVTLVYLEISGRNNA